MARKARRAGRRKGTLFGKPRRQVILKTLHRLRYGYYPLGVLYLFPTSDDVTDFSTSRFKPLIKDNPRSIGQFVRDTDRANLKRPRAFKAKAKKAGMSTSAYARKVTRKGSKASTRTKRQANLSKQFARWRNE